MLINSKKKLQNSSIGRRKKIMKIADRLQEKISENSTVNRGKIFAYFFNWLWKKNEKFDICLWKNKLAIFVNLIMRKSSKI